MSGLTSLVLNVVAGAYVPGAGRALGTRDNVEPQLLLAGSPAGLALAARTPTALLNLVGNSGVHLRSSTCHSE